MCRDCQRRRQRCTLRPVAQDSPFGDLEGRAANSSLNTSKKLFGLPAGELFLCSYGGLNALARLLVLPASRLRVLGAPTSRPVPHAVLVRLACRAVKCRLEGLGVG